MFEMFDAAKVQADLRPAPEDLQLGAALLEQTFPLLEIKGSRITDRFQR